MDAGPVWCCTVGPARPRRTIWFSQSLRTGEVRLIDYYENSGQGFEHYAKVLQDKGYVYGQHWAPHDIRVRELGTGKTRLDTARALGITFHIVPNIGLDEGINAVRSLLPRCWLNAETTEEGLEALTHYKNTFNVRTQQFGPPERNFATHGADAFRMLAVRHKAPAPAARRLLCRVPENGQRRRRRFLLKRRLLRRPTRRRPTRDPRPFFPRLRLALFLRPQT